MVRTTLEVQKDTLERLKEAGKKGETYDKLINQRITCNAINCNREGKIALKLEVGRFGFVSLFVCENCIGKFVEPIYENDKEKLPAETHIDKTDSKDTPDGKDRLFHDIRTVSKQPSKIVT